MNGFQPTRHQRHWHFAVLAGVALMLAAAFVAPYDISTALSLRTEKLPGDLRRVLMLSEIWGHGMGAILVIITLWLVAPRARRPLVPLAVGCLVAGALTKVVKSFVWRWRPGHYWNHLSDGAATWIGFHPPAATEATQGVAHLEADIAAVAETAGQRTGFLAELNWEWLTQSFPSGHSASAFALAYGLTMIAPRGAPIYWLLAIAACVQRVSFNAHWPSDVLAGAAIGILTAAVVFRLFPRWVDAAPGEGAAPKQLDGQPADRS